MSEDLWKLGVAELGVRYRAGMLTPSALLEAVLQRVAAVNPVVNAFATLDEAGARQAAAQSDERWQLGAPLGPLDGIPVSIKDNIAVKGLRCAWGSEVFLDVVPEQDELPVARLRAAGAVILGKTNTSEFSTGRGIVSTQAFGTTRNPWQPEFTAGSSSGGAAAAVSSGMGVLGLGTDGGGSIRRPAAHCGLIGLKTTTGHIARTHGLPIILNGREVIGPLARDTDDLACLLRAIAGPHPLDQSSWTVPPPESEPAVRPRRILFVPRFGDRPVAPEITEACAAVAGNLQRLGHQVEEGLAPFDTELQDRCGPLISCAGVTWLMRGKDWRGRIGDYYANLVERGSQLSAADYIEALDGLRTVQGQIGLFFEDYDLMLTPATAVLPWPADVPAVPYENTFPPVANTAGVPAISIPAGLSPQGLPIGFQLMGRFGTDWELIALARQYEAAHPWRDLWPSI